MDPATANTVHSHSSIHIRESSDVVETPADAKRRLTHADETCLGIGIRRLSGDGVSDPIRPSNDFVVPAHHPLYDDLRILGCKCKIRRTGLSCSSVSSRSNASLGNSFWLTFDVSLGAACKSTPASVSYVGVAIRFFLLR